MNKTCCKDCMKRYSACHDDCKEYKEFKKYKKLENDKARAFKSNSAGWDGYHKYSKNKVGEL